MHRECDRCGLDLEREPGFYLGSIYINYGLTALTCAVAYPLLSFGFDVPSRPLMGVLFAFCVFFPLWFFRYARSLWLGMDFYFDPDDAQKLK